MKILEKNRPDSYMLKDLANEKIVNRLYLNIL